MADEKFNLSRRKTLAALGTIGAASAGAGFGTSAFFNDSETFENNRMVAGTLNLKVGWQQIYYGSTASDPAPVRPRTDDDGEFVNAHPDSDGDGQQDVTVGGTNYTWNMGGATGSETDVTDKLSCDTIGENYEADYGDQDSLVALDDVKPGDGGQITFNLCLCDNPGYLWLIGKNFSQSGGENPEPEQDAEGDADNDANLAEHMDVYVSYDANCNSRFNDEDTTVWSGTLQELIDLSRGDSPEANGLMLGEDCFAGDTCHCFNVGWEVAESVGNAIQGDSVSFDLGFYTEQCRHNEDPSLNNDVVTDSTTTPQN